MSVVDLHVEDIGTLIRLTIKENNGAVDFSGSEFVGATLLLQKKDKTVVEFPLEFYTDGTDGKFKYVTQEGDIDQKGTWKAQVYIQETSGSWHTSIVDLVVEDNLA
jgi:hypothetical protein